MSVEAKPASERLRWRELLVLTALLAATAAVYARALGGELVYDDRLLIGRNPRIADLGNLPRLLTSGYWDFLGLQEAEYIGYWRPLTALVQALIWPWAGSAPGAYHAACLLVHLGATAAAFFLARALARSTWVAAATALLFALHPAHVESVAWISALNDPLFGCLALLSAERFLAWRRRGSRGWPILATAAFALALLAKELGAALVPLFLLLDALRPRAPGEPEHPLEPAAGAPRWLRAALSALERPQHVARAYGPLAAAFALYLVARMLVFASPLAGFDRITTDFGVSAWRLLLLRLELFGGGLEILCFPIELNLFRPFRPYLAPLDPALVRALVYGAVFAALLLACFLGRRRCELFALLVIPAGLLPALVRVESLGVFPLSERFLYLPVFGFTLAAALLLARAPRRTGTPLVLLLGGLYAARSFERIGFWHDEETLFRRSAQQNPRSVYVLWGLGRVLLERVNATGDPRFLQEALAVYDRAEALLREAKEERTDLMVSSRDYLQVNLGYAWCYIYRGDLAASIQVLEDLARRIETIEQEEREARAIGLRVRDQFLDLEKVYTALGVAHFKSREYEEAERAFLRALALQPASAETHQNLGRMYAEQGRWELAVREFEATTALRPGNPEDRLLLAQALQTLGESARAEELARGLVEELPGRAEPCVVLATAALRRADSTTALAWLDRALAIAPRNALAWYQKARAFLLRNEPHQATIAFRSAVELDPASFEAHYDFGAFLLASGALAEARPLLVRAYTLAPSEHREPLRRTLAELEFSALDEPFQLALADWGRKELEPALQWLERCLALDPEHVDSLLMRARILRRQEREAEAIAAFRRCSELAPRSFAVWSEFASVLYELGELEQARPALEHALELEVPASWPPELRTSSKERLRELLRGMAPAAEPE